MYFILEISLISNSNERNKLIVASSFGNNNLKCNEENESSSVLKYGLKIDEQYHVASNMMKLTKENHWTEDYHSYVLSWTPENTIFKIDGESSYLDTSNLPLDAIFDSTVKQIAYFV